MTEEENMNSYERIVEFFGRKLHNLFSITMRISKKIKEIFQKQKINERLTKD